MKVITTILLLLLAIPSAIAGGRLEEIQARGVLLVSVKNEGAASPSEHKDPAHFQKRGLEVELAGLIAGRILGGEGKVDLRIYPRRERLAAVANGTVDIGLSMFAITAENREFVDFSEAYYEGGLAILQKAESRLERIEDLEGRKIAAMSENFNNPGGELLALAAARGVKVDVEYLSSFEDGVRRIEAGELDGMVAPNANLDVFLAGRPGLRRSPLLSQQQFAVAVGKGEPELLAIVNDVILELKKAGELSAMLRKWGLSSEAPLP